MCSISWSIVAVVAVLSVSIAVCVICVHHANVKREIERIKNLREVLSAILLSKDSKLIGEQVPELIRSLIKDEK